MGSAAAPCALSEGKPKLEIGNQTEPARTTFRELQVENQKPKAKTLELKTKN
jgi:hypothetical protein